MRLPFCLHVVGILSAMSPSIACCQADEIYIVSYVEIMPPAVRDGTALLNRYHDASRQQRGNLRSTVLHEIGRSDRFAIMEMWTDKTAVENHRRTPSILEFFEKLKAIQTAPVDERVENGLFVEPIQKQSPAEALYVLTHVDIAPEHSEDGLTLLRAMHDNSVDEPGNVTYEVLQQENRTNHFALVEEWASMKALDTHIESQHTRAFRQALLPMQGALYDERRYERLR
jgi:(4S)-4-hydroxy-5-phosphonooxypentane-2,3-dione isomerase